MFTETGNCSSAIPSRDIGPMLSIMVSGNLARSRLNVEVSMRFTIIAVQFSQHKELTLVCTVV